MICGEYACHHQTLAFWAGAQVLKRSLPGYYGMFASGQRGFLVLFENRVMAFSKFEMKYAFNRNSLNNQRLNHNSLLAYAHLRTILWASRSPAFLLALVMSCLNFLFWAWWTPNSATQYWMTHPPPEHQQLPDLQLLKPSPLLASSTKAFPASPAALASSGETSAH